MENWLKSSMFPPSMIVLVRLWTYYFFIHSFDYCLLVLGTWVKYISEQNQQKITLSWYICVFAFTQQIFTEIWLCVWHHAGHLAYVIEQCKSSWEAPSTLGVHYLRLCVVGASPRVWLLRPQQTSVHSSVTSELLGPQSWQTVEEIVFHDKQMSVLILWSAPVTVHSSSHLGISAVLETGMVPGLISISALAS